MPRIAIGATGDCVLPTSGRIYATPSIERILSEIRGVSARGLSPSGLVRSPLRPRAADRAAGGSPLPWSKGCRRRGGGIRARHIACVDHVHPRHVRVSLAKCRRHRSRSLAQHSQVVGNRLLSVPVRLEAIPIACCQLSDIRERSAHVPETIHVCARAQSETASRSMRSRSSARPGSIH